MIEPEYRFTKQLDDIDTLVKETASFECEVNDEEAQVKWFKADKVSIE